MYEKFTDRLRKVMQLANQEAQRLNHEYVGTEHILLGLIKEGSGVAIAVLKELGVDLGQIRMGVEKICIPGPSMVTMGKLPHTPRAQVAIKFAIEESARMGDRHVGTEHMLIGFMLDYESVAKFVLCGLTTIEAVRSKVAEIRVAGQAKNAVMQHIEKVYGIRMQYIEMMAASFAAHTNLPIDECELVEQGHDDGKTSWYFRKRPTGGQS